MTKAIRCLALVVGLFAVAGLALGQDRRPAETKRESPEAKADRTQKFDAGDFVKKHDKNNDGKLGRDELPADMQDHFAQLDRDKDGFLSRQELERHGRQMTRRARAVDVLFIFIDANPDDTVSHGELQQAYDMLRKIDANNDGKLDPKELAGAREHFVKERVENMFRELDTNKDGKLTRAEASGMPTEQFGRLDSNKDDVLSKEELLKAAAARHGGRERVAPTEHKEKETGKEKERKEPDR